MSRQRFRIKDGGQIDRARRVKFRFNGWNYTGYAGDTLASALLANGVRLVGRSFKYHRPRGIYSAGPEEPNALVQLGDGGQTVPNVRATMVELTDGLSATSVNVWPSLRFDLLSINDRVSHLLPAGFYYKTFMSPAFMWPTYENWIRRSAGLGRVPEAPDPDRYDKRHVHCDVLVVGGGPAGLMAARAAAQSGARVIIADERAQMGGQLLASNDRIGGQAGGDWAAEIASELATRADCEVLTRTTAALFGDHNFVVLSQRVTGHVDAPEGDHVPRERIWKVRAQQVVLATGATERPLVFPDNDRPGVMLASAAGDYVHRYGVRPGRTAVVAGNNDSIYPLAHDLLAAGVRVVALADARNEAGSVAEVARADGIEVLTGHAVTGTKGRMRLRGVSLAPIADDGLVSGNSARRFSCDLLCVSGGFSPTAHLLSQAGGRLAFDDKRGCLIPAHVPRGIRMAGSANGTFELPAVLAEGGAAGVAAAEAVGLTTGALPEAVVDGGHGPGPVRTLWKVVADGRKTKQFVDLHNDATTADIALAAREGYRSVEHVKRYTTTGMGPDQGKLGNVNALGVLADELGRPLNEVGTTTFRPPYTPVTFGALAGRDIGALAEPVRTTPLHAWHVRTGAKFEDVGQWKRPRYYPRGGENMAQAVARECRHVRTGVGLLDASTLGKIELKGPEVGEFLNRIYSNRFDNLPVGRCRYGLMLGEDGMVFDDGVTARIAENHWYMTTTTGGAARVHDWLEDWLQCEWPDLQVFMTSVSAQWATVTLTGPNARHVLADLVEDIDLSAEKFPHLHVREARVVGLPARIFRVSFTGELSYEINVPARYGMALWQALVRAGERFDISPFGIEALHVLRAEKGYIVVGHDTDATVTPDDLGMGRMAGDKKDYFGRRSLRRSDTARSGRRQLVGLLPEEFVPEGAQIIDGKKLKTPVPMIGHVTSSYASTTLKRPIALALIEDGRNMVGERVRIALPFDQRVVMAEVTSPVFYDPEGSRLND